MKGLTIPVPPRQRNAESSAAELFGPDIRAAHRAALRSDTPQAWAHFTDLCRMASAFSPEAGALAAMADAAEIMGARHG